MSRAAVETMFQIRAIILLGSVVVIGISIAVGVIS